MAWAGQPGVTVVFEPDVACGNSTLGLNRWARRAPEGRLTGRGVTTILLRFAQSVQAIWIHSQHPGSIGSFIHQG